MNRHAAPGTLPEYAASAGAAALIVGDQPDDIIDASFFLTAGEAVPVTVIRGEEKMTFNIHADFHPASQRPAVVAQPSSTNQALPLSLQRAPERTP